MAKQLEIRLGGQMDYKISVIVSMYNIEKYVEECIISLVNQTLKDIEIILVNDGSKDTTLDIAKRVSSNYSNIKIIDKPNGGLSSARNTGLRVATGEYVAFVDGDDYILPKMYELMYKSAVENNSDMVMIGYKRLQEDGKLVNNREITMQEIFIKTNVITENKDVIRKILLQMLGMLPEAELDIELNMSVWRNIYRRALLQENSVEFVSERIYISEDYMFHLDFLPLCKVVSTVCEATYIYRYNASSLTKSYKEDRYKKECFLYEAICKKISELQLGDEALLRIQRTFIGRARNCISSELFANKIDSKKKVFNNISSILDSRQLCEVLKEYPIRLMPVKIRIFTEGMRYKFTSLVILLCKIKYRR